MTEAAQENKKSIVAYLSALVWAGVPRIERWLIELSAVTAPS